MITSDEAIKTLKKVWNVTELKFLAEFYRPKDSEGKLIARKYGKEIGYLRGFLANDREIFYPKSKDENEPKYDMRVSFKLPLVEGLEDGKFYLVELELDEDKNRLINPYQLKIKNLFIIEEDHISPKDFIKNRFFEKGHTPSDASTIASQLSLNELELYTHTKRFIFELIQNADDMPRHGNPVNIDIFLTQNHLLFLHNGKFFDREDVRAICDAAKSTKKSNVAQTGYKGIGFKSVFTDSSRVYIKSGSYSFKFDKTEKIYSDFWKLYDGYYQSLNSDARGKFEKQYKGKEMEFLSIDNIPWQIKPIWVENQLIPQEIRVSPFNDSTYQVAIALNVGEEVINDSEKDYNRMIIQLIQEPRFLLFLRHSEKLSYKRLYPEGVQEATIDVEVKRKKDSIIVSKNNQIISNYIKRDIEISLNNDDFINAGLNFQKVVKKDKVAYVDVDGRPLDNIPEKLVNLSKTTISFAAQLNYNNIVPIPSDNSILFNYLPTSDSRFGFHFLINGDFVCKTDREFIQVENKWNHYLFYHIGYNLIKWLADLAVETDNDNRFIYLRTYLNLLPAELLDEDNEEQGSINKAFNNGIKKAIKNLPFLISYFRKPIKCEDVIIDATGITRALKNNGGAFFRNICKSKKSLPFFLTDDLKLRKDYLEIEMFEADDLIASFVEKSNIKIFAELVLSLDNESYLEIIRWFENFITQNTVDNNFIISLPIFRFSDVVCSISELNTNSNLFVRSEQFKPVQMILNKLGFKLTEIEFDKYESIWDRINSYIVNDLEIYNRLSNNNGLQNLSPKDKNDLLLFISTLNGVGKEKFAMSLPLFGDQSELKNNRPLRKLISNKILDLPEWLNHMRIDSNEEKYLDSSFQKHLLLESDLLGQILNDELLFKIATSKISEENIDEFYVYIQKLIKSKDDSLVGLSEIPWLYIETNKSFIKADQAYFPDSILKLNNSKFNNTKAVINDITNLNIPHFNSFEIIKGLSLGSSRINFTDTIEKNGIFDLELINDFLDWVVENKEDNFLSEMLIVHDVEGYKIVPAEGKKSYYTSSTQLIEFINGHESLKDVFCLFDNNLYSSSRKKIGLLEDGDLIENIINDGGGNLHLVQHITSSVSKDVIGKYLLNLGKFDIDTTKSYDSTTDIYKVINLVLDNILEDEEITNKFKTKLQIDSVPLLERAISDDIFFYKTTTQLKTKLSDVLTEYKDKVYSLTNVLNSFENIDKSKLKKFFEPFKIPTNRIFTELQQKYTYLNPVQTFFLLYYQKQLNVTNPFADKSYFIDKFEINKNEYGKSAQEFLTICCNENYKDFAVQINLPDFKPSVLIIEEPFALNSELLPDWVKKWSQSEDSEIRLNFLKQLGVNDITSQVVILRKAILEGVVDMDAARGNLNNKVLFENTLIWMKDNKSKCKSIYNEDLLKLLYNKAYSINISIKDIPIPVIDDIEKMTYSLELFQPGIVYHKYNSTWNDHKEKIFKHLSINNIKVVSDVLNQNFRTNIGTVNYSVLEELDQEKIKLNSEDFTDKFYTTWTKKSQFVIKKYRGSNLPYKITYNSYLITTYEKDFAVKNGDYYLVCENIINNIPYTIKNLIPSTLYSDLDSHIKEFKSKINEIDYTDEEIAILKKFLNDDEIPEEFRKNFNLAALVSALIYLSKQGFDIDSANNNLGNTHEYAQLDPVYKNGKQYTIMCRSARHGLLYMTVQAWNRLDIDSILLFADTGNETYKLFYDKQEVLNANDKDTDYQILRIETDANVSDVDAILNGTFKQKNKIWMIFLIKENKKYNSLYYEDLKPNNTSNNKSSLKNDYSDINGY